MMMEEQRRLKMKCKQPIGKSKCEEKIICLHFPDHFQWIKYMAAKTNATGAYLVLSLGIKK